MICPKCNTEMTQGKALQQTWRAGLPDLGGSEVQTMHVGGPGKLIDCMKCPECGFSREKGEKE